MKKTLLIYSRICPTQSQHTQKIFQELSKLDFIETMKLDGSKPFDSLKEQEYIKQFDNIILLFTMNWFNLPWNLSRYMAEVWRVGDFNLQDKNIYRIITCGSKSEIYQKDSAFGYNVDEYLNNLNSVYKRLKANKKDDYIYYGAVEYNEERLEKFISDLVNDLKSKF